MMKAILTPDGVKYTEYEPTDEQKIMLEQMEAEDENKPVMLEERVDDIEQVADMAYVNSELALAMIEEAD